MFLYAFHFIGVNLNQLHSVTDTVSPSPLASTSSSSDSLASGTSRTFVPSTPYGDSMSTETHSTPHTVTQSTPHTVTQSTPHTVTKSTPHTLTRCTPHTVTQSTPHTITQSTPHSGMVVSDSEGGSDLEMSNSSSSSLPQSTNVQVRVLWMCSVGMCWPIIIIHVHLYEFLSQQPLAYYSNNWGCRGCTIIYLIRTVSPCV